MLRIISNNIDSVETETYSVLDELIETLESAQNGTSTYIKRNYNSIFRHTEEASNLVDENLASINGCIEKLEIIKTILGDCKILNNEIRLIANEKKISTSTLQDTSLETVQTRWDVDKLQGKDIETVRNVRSDLEEKGMRSKEGLGSINDLKRRNIITHGGKRKRKQNKKTKKRFFSKKNRNNFFKSL
jgi:hypothetical protein